MANTIVVLQRELAAANAEIAALNAGLEELRAYISGPKFSCGDEQDGLVRVGDVGLRLLAMRVSAERAREVQP